MNKRGDENRSVRNTKKKLRNGLLQLMEQKSINEITVKELTELVDINRGTFYFHYSDVADLLHKIEDDFFFQFYQRLNNDVRSNDDAYPYLQAVFSFLKENHDLCKILFSENGDILFANRIRKLVEERAYHFWQQTVLNHDEKRMAIYNAFMINGCIGVIQNWLNNGMQESTEEISQLTATMILSSIQSCILGKSDFTFQI